MSKEVDERVVEMRFNNALFESKVQQTMRSLAALNEKLMFKGAEKGFEKVSDSSEKVKFNALLNALDNLSQKFSAVEVIGVTALMRITNQAVDAGERLVKALSLDPIISGFQEYETQINAVQTILANTSSKGTTLDQVNAALDELNHYADLTIYNFTEMTRNIGTFTAAGVDLNTSVSAIKGIANLAAVSGSTSQQASTAMYQLSQALASGTVKLQDWNSVVNAGMGGQVFQDALKETARVHGIAIDSMIKKEGSFRETLSKGWLTSSILTETLQKFTGDLNEETLKSIGYTDEQIKKIMEISKVMGDDYEYTPQIVPVVDLTNVLEGADEIDNAFAATKSLSLDGDVSRNLADKIDAEVQLQNGLKSAGNEDTLRAINALAGHMDGVAESIKGMSVTINGRKAIGYIDDRMGRLTAAKVK